MRDRGLEHVDRVVDGSFHQYSSACGAVTAIEPAAILMGSFLEGQLLSCL